MPASIGILGAAHAGKHAECPVTSPIAGNLIPAQIRKFTGNADVFGIIDVFDIFRGIKPLISVSDTVEKRFFCSGLFFNVFWTSFSHFWVSFKDASCISSEKYTIKSSRMARND
jgi:hypothetical protein